MAQITPTTIKQRLVGLGPWLDAAAALPSPYTYDDDSIAANIQAMIRGFERDAQFTINPVQFWSTNDGANPQIMINGTPAPQIYEDPYEYQDLDTREYCRIQLKHRPIYMINGVPQIQRLRFMYGTMVVWEPPVGWFSVKAKAGLFHLIPVFGSITVAAAAIGYSIMINMSNRQYLANGISIDYVCGLPQGTGPTDAGNWQNMYEWSDLVYAVNEYCAYSVLKDISELADAGLANVSTSGGGSSEQHTYTRFRDRKQELLDSAIHRASSIKEQETLVQLGFI